jgi:hypothetical protein
MANVTYRLSNEQLLERLKLVSAENGKLTCKVIQQSRLCPSVEVYRSRFGGLMNVYALLGYNTSDLIAQATARLRCMIVRRLFIRQFLDCFPEQLEEVRATKRFRPVLRLRKTGLLISVVVARIKPTARTRQPRWLIEIPKPERKRVAILGIMDENNARIIGMNVFRNMQYPNATSPKFGADSAWFHAGERLMRVSDFLEVLKRIRAKLTDTL